jgi:RNA polymerase sigma-70 factor (ECF subfamily)
MKYTGNSESPMRLQLTNIARRRGIHCNELSVHIDWPRMQKPDQSSLSSSLLVRVRNHDAEAWRRLVSIYSPLVYRWCRRSHLKPDEAMDVVQEVFRAVLIAIGQFRRDRQGDTFQGWLRTVTRNKTRDFFRSAARRPAALGGTDAQRRLEEIADDSDEDAAGSVSDDKREVLVHALEQVRAEFEEKTWKACWQTAVEGETPRDVAKALAMTLGAVYKAKSRVLARLRIELDGLVDF